MSAPACGRARRILWPDDAPRIATTEVIAARRHLESCESCREFTTEMRSLAEAIASTSRREKAPLDVRDRLFTAVARERARPTASAKPTRIRVAGWAAAIAATVILGAGLVQLREAASRPERSDLLAALAEDHVRSAAELHLASSDTGRLTTWITSQISFGMHVPVLPGARLRGARVALVDGRRSAVVEYEVGSRIVSYFVIPHPGAEARATSGRAHLEMTSRAGFQMVAWREPGLMHAMVGDLPSARLADLAHACMAQVGGNVAWVEWADLPDA